MQLKTIEVDGTTYAEVVDGKPVYIDNGTDVPFDIAGVTALRGEAMRHRKDKEAAEKRLREFEGIEDPEAARQALETVSNLDAKKLIDVGEVDRVKTEVARGFEAKLAEKDQTITGLQGELHAEKIGGAFTRSPMIVGEKAKFAVPADIVEARFGKHFKLEDGKVVATDSNGNRIYSKSNPSELAGFDEALEQLVELYPHKDSILKGTGSSGTGASGGVGTNTGPKVMKTAEFNALSPQARAAKMEEGYTLQD